jgi:hypothetical protein
MREGSLNPSEMENFSLAVAAFTRTPLRNLGIFSYLVGDGRF